MGTFVLLVGDKIDDLLPTALDSAYADSSAARSAGGPPTELDFGYADSSAANSGYADDSSPTRSADVPSAGRRFVAAGSAALKV